MANGRGRRLRLLRAIGPGEDRQQADLERDPEVGDELRERLFSMKLRSVISVA
jgi:hypothetical protein